LLPCSEDRPPQSADPENRGRRSAIRRRDRRGVSSNRADFLQNNAFFRVRASKACRKVLSIKISARISSCERETFLGQDMGRNRRYVRCSSRRLRSPPTVPQSPRLCSRARAARRVALERPYVREDATQAVLRFVRSFVGAIPGPDKHAERCGPQGAPMRSLAILRPDGKSGDLDAHGARPGSARRRGLDKNTGFYAWSLGQNRKLLLLCLKKTAKMARQIRPHSCRVGDRGGKFGGMGRCPEQRAGSRIRAPLPYAPALMADGCVRVGGGSPFLASSGRSPVLVSALGDTETHRTRARIA